MLNKDEELRLARCLSVARNDARISIGESSEYFHSDLNVETVLWLAEKCKELNEEASGYYESYMTVNRELTRFREYYEG